MTLSKNAVLKELRIEKNGVIIEELPFVGKINLRGNQNDREFLSNVGSVLNILIPLDPNTKVQNKEFQVIWLSPNEWLISFFKNKIFTETLNKLNEKLNFEKTSVTDISDNKTIIRIESHNASELLKKFMVIDIDKVLKDNSRVAQTIFVKIPILILRNHLNDKKQSFDIHVNRSHTIYLKNILLDGCNQFIN